MNGSPDVDQGLFRGLVLGRQLHVRAAGVGDAGVGDQPDAGILGGLDGVPMLLKALPDLTAGDQQHLAGTGKGRRREAGSW